MGSPGLSLKVFGLYLILVPGLGLAIMPHQILDMFGLSHGPDLWLPRMVGVLAGIIGGYYLVAVKHQLVPLFVWSVRMRLLAAAVMCAIWGLGEVEAGILLFAAVDVAGATWTALALRSEQPALLRVK